jgi:large subunit ribosomal protein L21
MYAVVEIGGFQYRVREKDVILVPKLPIPVGETFVIDRVLLLSNKKKVIGTPTVKGAKVIAKVLSFKKSPKIIVFKFKKRKRYHVKKGHRQILTEILIEKIEGREEK